MSGTSGTPLLIAAALVLPLFACPSATQSNDGATQDAISNSDALGDGSAGGPLPFVAAVINRDGSVAATVGGVTSFPAGAGTYALSFPVGRFSSAPVCTVTDADPNGQLEVPIIVGAASASSVGVHLEDQTGAAVMGAFNIICVDAAPALAAAVNADGTLAASVGGTMLQAKGGPGSYSLTFTGTFSLRPICTVTDADPNGKVEIPVVGVPAPPAAVSVTIDNLLGTPVDGAFNTICAAAGPFLAAVVNADGSIASSVGGITLRAKGGAGSYTLNFPAGRFSAAPICTVTGADPAGAAMIPIIGGPPSATTASVTLNNTTGVPKDGAFNMICVGTD